MIMLTKLNKEEIMINEAQIESVEFIPESKVLMMNGRYYVVRESAEEIIEKCVEYNGAIENFVPNR